MTETERPPFVLNDALYDKIKWIIVIILPALGTLYFALAKLWELPAGEQILGTLIAFQTFLGTIFAISTTKYKNSDIRFDGTLTTSEKPDKHIVSVETDLHPSELAKKDEVVLKVK